VSEDASGLYKTTVTIWTAYPADGMDLAALAQRAADGGAHCSERCTVLVPRPEADPAAPGPGFPGPSGKVALRLLCDTCFEAATGEVAQCQPGCRREGLDDNGPCLWPEGPDECQWCGQADRLTPLPADHPGLRRLPVVGERDDGGWWLSQPGSGTARGPYNSPEDAWHAWHLSQYEQRRPRQAAEQHPPAAGRDGPELGA